MNDIILAIYQHIIDKGYIAALLDDSGQYPKSWSKNREANNAILIYVNLGGVSTNIKLWAINEHIIYSHMDYIENKQLSKKAYSAYDRDLLDKISTQLTNDIKTCL